MLTQFSNQPVLIIVLSEVNLKLVTKMQLTLLHEWLKMAFEPSMDILLENCSRHQDSNPRPGTFEFVLPFWVETLAEWSSDIQSSSLVPIAFPCVRIQELWQLATRPPGSQAPSWSKFTRPEMPIELRVDRMLRHLMWLLSRIVVVIYLIKIVHHRKS